MFSVESVRNIPPRSLCESRVAAIRDRLVIAPHQSRELSVRPMLELHLCVVFTRLDVTFLDVRKLIFSFPNACYFEAIHESYGYVFY